MTTFPDNPLSENAWYQYIFNQRNYHHASPIKIILHDTKPYSILDNPNYRPYSYSLLEKKRSETNRTEAQS